MIDIHTHILPQIDDGAQSWEESLEMLRQGQEDGIQTVVLTPHLLSNLDLKNEREIISKYTRLKKLAASQGIKMEILLGAEIYVQPNMPLEHRIATLNNNGKYFLIEFPMTSIPDYVADKFFEVIMDGKIPIIAHPERNIGFLKKPYLAYEFVQRGALMQINSGSVRGKFGQAVKKLATQLIDHNLAHFVASDCHDSRSRTLQLKKTWEVVEEQWGKDTAKLLFIENPYKAIHGEKILAPEPIPIESPSSKISLGKLLNIFRRVK